MTELNLTRLQMDILTILSVADKRPKELAHLLNCSRTWIYDNFEVLEKKKLIEKYSIPRSTRGRPITKFKLTGVDINCLND